MSLITAIEAQQRHKHRRSIFVDGEFFAGVDQEVVALLSLKTGQTIKPADLKSILEREEEVRARELVLRWLDISARTRRQLADRLRLKGVEDEVAGRVLDRLQAAGVINDDAYAREWIKAKTRGGAMGRRRISAELARRGVDRDTAAGAMADEGSTDETEAVADLARRKAATYRGLDRDVARRRLVGFLSRRGFALEDIFRAVDAALPKNEESD
jgi:regulatory protein